MGSVIDNGISSGNNDELFNSSYNIIQPEDELNSFYNFHYDLEQNNTFITKWLDSSEKYFWEYINSKFQIIFPSLWSKKDIDIDTVEATKKSKIVFIIKQGKKRRREIEEFERRKFDEDNICKKIKNYYIKFIIKFINFITGKILDENNISFQLHLLTYKYQKKFDNKYIIEFSEKTIEEVLTLNDLYNKKICENIKKEPKLKDVSEILKKKVFSFFEEVFYSERKKIYNLKEFGLSDFEFDMPKDIKLFDDLLLKNSNGKCFNIYKRKMQAYCRKYFMPKLKKLMFKTRCSRRKNKKNN